jgi:Raf kinase inhibitor-like YbhB/YbcL family protein
MLQAMIKQLPLVLSFALTLVPLVGSAQQTSLPARLPDPKAADVAVQGYVYEPVAAKPDRAAARHLHVPPGFQVNVFASDLGNARMLAVADDGGVYVTRRDEGDLLLARDTNGDGRAEQVRVVARRPGMHGVAVAGRKIYLVTVKDVYTADLERDGSVGQLRRIIADLPDAGQHPNRTIAVGPDGMLYLSVGSTCNACEESSPESAALLRASPDGKSRTVYASGLRNTIGFDWHPRTGELWGMDQGIDWLGNEAQREELNRLEQGAQYGWPYIYEDGKQNPQDDPPGGITMTQWDSMSRQPALTYTAHAASMQMAFYTGRMFPEEFRGDAFVAMRGSWNRKPPAGYEIVRIRFQDGKPAAMEPFVTGFLQQRGTRFVQLGRVAGLVMAADGSLLFSDDENGIIYRVSTASGLPSRADGLGWRRRPATVTKPQPRADSALAIVRPETRTTAQLRVSSTEVRSTAQMPRRYTAYGENLSPALAWSGAPRGTRSFVVLMEDPDARRPKPFIHWVAYDIPGDSTALATGVPPVPRTVAPVAGMLQGRNSRGTVGYFGPRPPVGDPPHRYYFQVFALDRMSGLQPGATREEVLAAMDGHVLARGQLVVRYGQSSPPTQLP